MHIEFYHLDKVCYVLHINSKKNKVDFWFSVDLN